MTRTSHHTSKGKGALTTGIRPALERHVMTASAGSVAGDGMQRWAEHHSPCAIRLVEVRLCAGLGDDDVVVDGAREGIAALTERQHVEGDAVRQRQRAGVVDART